MNLNRDRTGILLYLFDYIISTKNKHSTDLRPVRVCDKAPSPEPPRAETPPDLGEIKRDIIDQIKMHLESRNCHQMPFILNQAILNNKCIIKVQLDVKYEAINEEFANLKKTNKSLQSSLGNKLRNLTTDFEEWKTQEPTIIIHPDRIINPVVKEKQKPHPSLNLEQKLIRLRSELPHLMEAEPCVARWPQNGWYYKSTIKRYLGDYRYKIIGENGESTEVYREDLIQENVNDIHSFEVRKRNLSSSKIMFNIF